jgi:hypothetical protein
VLSSGLDTGSDKTRSESGNPGFPLSDRVNQIDRTPGNNVYPAAVDRSGIPVNGDDISFPHHDTPDCAAVQVCFNDQTGAVDNTHLPQLAGNNRGV